MSPVPISSIFTLTFRTYGSQTVRPLIYVVDDDEDVRESLTLVLETCGYCVDSFRDGAELMTRGDFGLCRCMILDVHLPGESGIEILASLRFREIPLPVILTSGQGTHDIRHKARQLNAVAFFDKPIHGKLLLETIAEIVLPAR